MFHGTLPGLKSGKITQLHDGSMVNRFRTLCQAKPLTSCRSGIVYLFKYGNKESGC